VCDWLQITDGQCVTLVFFHTFHSFCTAPDALYHPPRSAFNLANRSNLSAQLHTVPDGFSPTLERQMNGVGTLESARH